MKFINKNKKAILFLIAVYVFVMTLTVYKQAKHINSLNEQIVIANYKIDDLSDKIVEIEKDVDYILEEIIKTEDCEEPSLVNLGEFKLTAYCSCSKCCGKWAYNRPVDENGNEIVYGSIGERLVAGTSIAVDPKVIPYGSEVIINGHTYIAHDTGGAIKGNRIDVYFDDHQEARNFAVQYAEVFKVVEKSE